MSEPSQLIKTEKSGARGRIKAMTQKLSDLEGRIEETLERDIQLLEKGSKKMDKAYEQFAEKHRLATAIFLTLLGTGFLLIVILLAKNYYS